MAEKSFTLQQQIRHNAEELGDFLKDLNKWESDIKRQDDELKKSAEIEKIVPPIRRSGKRQQSSSSKRETKVKFKDQKRPIQKQRISSYDYDAWSKFDVDAACKDEDEEEKDDSDNSSEEEKDLEEDLKAEEKRKLQQAEFEKDKGNYLFKDGKFEAAINRYTIAADLNPRSAIIFANRAMALIKLERYAAAEVDCTKAIELEPDYAKAVARRATARARLKRFKEAKEDQERLLELQPNNKQAKLEIAKLEKELANIERKNQASAPTKRSKKPLRRIIIEDIGFDSDDESKSLQSDPSPKQQTEEKARTGKHQQSKSSEIANDVEANQKKSSLTDSTFQSARLEHSPRDISFAVPSTAFQFETEFKKFKKDSNLFYEYFKIISPNSYKTLFHHCIDELLPIALECIHNHYLRDQKEYWEELSALSDVPRFDMAVMFLSKDAKRVAAKLFENLLERNSNKEVDTEAIRKLAKKYSIALVKS